MQNKTTPTTLYHTFALSLFSSAGCARATTRRRCCVEYLVHLLDLGHDLWDAEWF